MISNLSLSQQEFEELIARGNAALEAASGEFQERLPALVQELDLAIKAEDADGAWRSAYQLSCTAANFGWAMVGHASKYMQFALDGANGPLGADEIVLVHLDAIHKLSDPNGREDPENALILERLQDLLTSKDLMPQ